MAKRCCRIYDFFIIDATAPFIFMCIDYPIILLAQTGVL